MEEEKKDEGIFTKQKINFHPKSEITSLLACNNLLVRALKNGVVMRIPLQQPDKQTEIDVPHSSGDRIAHLHLDPTGKHLLISMARGDVFYLHASMSKVKALPKLKGNVITAVGWNQQFGKDMDTGFIVVGTSKGLLFETELVQAGQVQYWKQLYSVSDDPSQPQPIVGLELHRCSTPPNRWCLFVATPGTLYPFAGTVSLQSTSTWTTTEHSGHLLPLFLADARIHTLDPVPPTNGPTGLKVYPMFGDDPPTRFAWVTAVGVKYGRMDTSAADAFRMTVDDELLTYGLL
uniref:Pep3/Vps18 beta-propeller domain-containing protein n=1 Tax=Plectus sambesii TaxID=2011161 RepID=A0A914WTC1_9BILA